MKLVIDIADNEAESLIGSLKVFSRITAKPLSAPDAAVLEELGHLREDQESAGN